MSGITLILLGAGNSTRFKTTVKKQWLYTENTPVWLWVVKRFESTFDFDDIIIVSAKQELHLMQNFADYTYVEGGDSRQASLKNALQEVNTPHVLVSDIARCCVPKEMILRIIEAKEKASCIVPALKVTDTLYFEGKPLDREAVRTIQTPQLSVTKLLIQALETSTLFTDESSAIASLGEHIHFVEGSHQAHKLTTLQDLHKLDCLSPVSPNTRIGFGIDTHPFQQGKEMFLGGIPIEVDYGFKAHSDGDVAIHALIDALLGAAGMGDIGEFYPDTDTQYAGIDSKVLLENTRQQLNAYGYTIQNIDMTILAETPKISPYKQEMKKVLSKILHIPKHAINIKATTAEKLGFVGRKEGVTVHAVANLTLIDWKTL